MFQLLCYFAVVATSCGFTDLCFNEGEPIYSPSFSRILNLFSRNSTNCCIRKPNSDSDSNRVQLQCNFFSDSDKVVQGVKDSEESNNKVAGLVLDYVNFPNGTIHDGYFKSFGHNLEYLNIKTRLKDLTLKDDSFNGLENSLKNLTVTYAVGNHESLGNLPKCFNKLSDLKNLKLEIKSLERLDENDFSNMKHLESLDLKFVTKFTSKGGTFFQKLPNLKTLIVQYASLNDTFWPNVVDLKNLERLILDNNNFKTLPDNQMAKMKNLKELRLDENKIENINENSFAGLEKLENLTISNCKLTNVHEKSFLPLKFLTTLDIHDNQQIKLPQNVFTHLGQLETLNLAENNMSQVPTEMFKKLTNLQSLDLRYNELKFIDPHWFDDLGYLKMLNLSHNKLNTLPGGLFQKLRSLMILRLLGNKIEQISPKAFDGLAGLERLDLQLNKIVTIPENCFASLKNLKILNLNHNGIRIISGFEGVTSLEELDLSTNNISRIGKDDFKKFTTLKFLDISWNPLTNIEDGSFDSLISLTHLSITNTLLKTVSMKIFTTPNLGVLYLVNNKFVQINGGTFSRLAKLEELWLDENRNLTKLDPQAFDNLTNLKLLSLDKSNISTVPENLLNTCTNLTYLDLSGTQIHSFTPSNFRPTKNLMRLLLGRLQIDQFPNAIFDELPNLKQMNVDGSKFVCNKHITKLIHWVKDHNDLFSSSNPASCLGPEKLKGRVLLSLTDSDL